MAMGMSYEQFWYDDPSMAAAFRKADMIRRKRRNQEMWWEGIYTAHALNATVGNMFKKGTKNEYPSEPMPLTEEDMREKQEREARARMEKMKAMFTAKALAVNAKLGGTEK